MCLLSSSNPQILDAATETVLWWSSTNDVADVMSAAGTCLVYRQSCTMSASHQWISPVPEHPHVGMLTAYRLLVVAIWLHSGLSMAGISSASHSDGSLRISGGYLLCAAWLYLWSWAACQCAITWLHTMLGLCCMTNVAVLFSTLSACDSAKQCRFLLWVWLQLSLQFMTWHGLQPFILQYRNAVAHRDVSTDAPTQEGPVKAVTCAYKCYQDIEYVTVQVWPRRQQYCVKGFVP